MLGRIAALLRKAEGTDNEHEAAAYMAAAQRLATLESIDLAVARAHTDKKQRPVPEQRTVTIGESGKRGLATYVQLFVAIARANEVTCDVARNSTFVYAYGFGADIDVCEAMYSSLVVQMVAACERFLRSGQHKEELTWGRDSRSGRWVRKPVHATTARINFQQAFAVVIGERLAKAREQANAEAEQQYAQATPAGPSRTSFAAAGRRDTRSSSLALAIREKEVAVRDFYSETSQARGAWRGSSAGYSEASRRAGRRAGRQARLGDPTEIGGARRAVESGG
ncbi:DUF2786 domain-containing protein [Nakamurella lactea]|uniref:DUF2786 domain-containing protein n=1 Tax=Nakamurella lactea TaxID=459515 RepID=UPI0005613892